MRRMTSRLGLLAALIAALVLAACTGPTPPNQPNQFAFEAAESVELSTPVPSNTVKLAGFNGELPADVSGGTLFVNDTEATTTPVNVSAGDEIYVVVTSSADHEVAVSATVSVGRVNATFTVTTRAMSTTPDAFPFNDVDDAELNTEVESDPVTLAGFDGQLEATITTGGTLHVNGAAVTTPANVSAGDAISVVVTSSSDYETPVSATVTIGTTTSTFTVTTKTAPTGAAEPDAFPFNDVDDAELNTEVESDPVTLAGFDGQLEATITTGGTLHVNGAAVTTPANVSAGDAISVVVTSSSDYETPVSATVTIGTTTSTFTVTTLAGPTITSFTDNAPNGALPGDDVTLSWVTTGDVANLELVLGDGTTQDVTGLTQYTVTAPEHQPDATFILTARNAAASASDDASHTVGVPLWTCINDDYAITFADSNLEFALRQRASPPINSTGDITCTQMRALTSFGSGHFATNRGSIKSLVGLQHATNLQNLVLQWNEISDITPIAGLTNLQVINFDKNRITDLSPLGNLTNLIEIGFWANAPVGGSTEDGIDNIDVLENLTNLEVVYLSDNNISSLVPIADLENIRVLWVIRNDIYDFSPLENMVNLKSLRIGWQREAGRPIDNPGVFSTLPNLTWVDMEMANLPDVDFLENLPNLYSVNLEGMRLNDINGLIANGSFPATVDPSELGTGASNHPKLRLMYNCLPTDSGTPTRNYIDSLPVYDENSNPTGVEITGYPEEQESCSPGLVPVALQDALLRELQQTEGYR